MYVCYYLRRVSAKPWCDNRFFITAAGDDVCVFSDDARLTDRIVNLIRTNTSRDSSTPSSLGQVVKSISVTPLEGAEFCSKWFHIAGDKLILTRDYVKTLCTKQNYTRKNAHILRTPALHRHAILCGVRSEEASHLLEDIILASTPPCDDSGQALVQGYLDSLYAPKPSNYEVERSVNARLGIGYFDLFKVLRDDALICGRRSTERPTADLLYGRAYIVQFMRPNRNNPSDPMAYP